MIIGGRSREFANVTEPVRKLLQLYSGILHDQLMHSNLIFLEGDIDRRIDLAIFVPPVAVPDPVAVRVVGGVYPVAGSMMYVKITCVNRIESKRIKSNRIEST